MTRAESEGLATFNKIVGVDSSIEVFLKCHLVLEFYLEELIRARAVNEQVLNIDRLTFSQKLNVCEGFGLLDQQEAGQLRTINRLRNRMAHGLGFAVTSDIAGEIEASLSERAGQIYGSLVESGPRGATLRHRIAWMFFAVIWSVGHVVQVLRFEQTNAETLEQFKMAMAVDSALGDGRSLARTGTRRSPEEVRGALGLPDYPDPRRALDLLAEATRVGAPLT